MAPRGVEYVPGPEAAHECDSIEQNHGVGWKQHMVGSKKNVSIDVEESRFERQQDRVKRQVDVYPFPHLPIVTEPRQEKRLRVLWHQLKVEGCFPRGESVGRDRKDSWGKEDSGDNCCRDSPCSIATCEANQDR